VVTVPQFEPADRAGHDSDRVSVTNETITIFCIAEESANMAAVADPEHAVAVRHRDARRSFLGPEVQLAGASGERVESLVREAWTTKAPRSLVKAYMGQA
jgi:hypothetical protein